MPLLAKFGERVEKLTSRQIFIRFTAGLAILVAIGITVGLVVKLKSKPDKVSQVTSVSTPTTKTEWYGGAEAGKDTITAAIHRMEPMIIIGDTLSGREFDVVDSVWASVDYTVRYVLKNNIQEIFADVQSDNGFEFGFGGITTHSTRVMLMDFSQPTILTGLLIAVKRDNLSIIGVLRSSWQKIWENFNMLLIVVGYIIIQLVIFPFFLWVIEREYDEGIPKKFYDDKDIWKSGWYAAYEVLYFCRTKIGCPVRIHSPKGGKRIIRWSVSLHSKFNNVAYIALFGLVGWSGYQEINSSGIESYQDLAGKRVGTKERTAVVQVLRDLGAKPKTTPILEESLEKLLKKKPWIDAVVHDAPAIEYWVKNHQDSVMIVGQIFEEQFYGVVFSKGSKLKDIFDQRLLEFREKGVYDKLVEPYKLVEE